jgi:hypothetical protein
MSLVDHAQRELALAGLLDSDADYEAELGQNILDTVTAFSTYGHSGGSAAIAVAALERLLRFKTLTPITNNPDEWMEVGPSVWQSKRQSSIFSKDSGKTWYDLDEDQ